MFISAAAGAFLVLGALPMGWLADRYRRGADHRLGDRRLLGDGVRRAASPSNAFTLFWARFGVGIAKSNTFPVQGSLIADTYPIAVRGAGQRDDRGRGARWPRC